MTDKIELSYGFALSGVYDGNDRWLETVLAFEKEFLGPVPVGLYASYPSSEVIKPLVNDHIENRFFGLAIPAIDGIPEFQLPF